MLIVFMVLPNFAVWSRLVVKGILISLTIGFATVCVYCVCISIAPFSASLGKSRAHLANISMQSSRVPTED